MRPSLSILLTLGVLASVPASDGLHAQATPLCKCSPSTPVAGQRFMVLQGGSWLVDLDAAVVAVRAELPMGRSGRWLFVPGLTFAHGDLRTGPTQTDVFVPEALLHYQLTRGRVRPYIGGGAGLALINMFDKTITGVVSVASGLRVDLGPQWGARLEVDTRISGFEAGSVGWGLGIAHRF